METFIGKTVVVLVSLLGVVSALNCLKCEWSVQNSTVDDSCLGAPYKVDSVECKGTSPGELFMCQTKATFSMNGGEKKLEALERTCGPKHASCDNACAENTVVCWQCCKDSSNCNGFPLRANIVLTSSASHSVMLFKSLTALFVLLYTI
ncbi:hypothetical protein ACF0H5_012534 [Mactra antiquata]